MATATANGSSVRGYLGPSDPGYRSKVQDHLKRYDALKRQRDNWTFDWQDIINYLCPGVQDVLGWRSPGQSRTEYMYDSMPQGPPQMLAANLQGAVTNPALQWFRLRFRDEALNDTQTINQWLQLCDTRMLAAYNASNFYQATHAYYVHLGAFGTAAMYIGTRLGTLGQHLHFKTLSPGTYCIAENADGLVDTLYREIEWTPRQAVQLFGPDDVSQKLFELYREPSQCDTPLKFLHCVSPRSDRNPRKADNRNMPYADVYIELDTQELVRERGFEEFPFVVSRWETLSNAPWGFGPGHVALPDVRTLNALRELNLQQLALWVQPPLKVLQEGVIGNISLESRALNVVRQQDALQALEVGGHPDLVQINQVELKQSIRDIFFVDALQGLPPPDASKMTAFEVAQRVEQMQRLMGPAFTRLLSEMLDPLADRVFGVMLRARALPQPPLEVLLAAQAGGGVLDVEYEGPLARSQRGVDIRAMGDTIRMGLEVAQATQRLDVFDNFDLDEWIRHLARINGVPRGLIIDIQQVRRQRQARQQVQAQVQQEAMTNERLAAMGRVAPVVQAIQQGPQQQRAA